MRSRSDAYANLGRQGFNLIELLVVIAIIATIVALLLPATCKVRNAAARMACSNKLKQLGIGLHAHRDAHGYFPAGTLSNASLPPDGRLSWGVAILPYIEQQSTYEKFDRAASWDSPANKLAVTTWTWGTFTCPSYATKESPPQPPTTYIGVAGIGPDAAGLPLEAPGVGFFGYDRTLKVEQIKDGTSQTLALIETGRDVGCAIRGGPSTVRGLDLSDEPLLGEGRPFGGMHRYDKRFGGTAPLGTQVLLVDGSTRTTPVLMDTHILGALATIAGREEVPEYW